MSRRDDTGRAYLNRLDAQTALHNLETAAQEAGQAGRRAGDIARRELQHDWQRFDQTMEDSTTLGSGPHGSPFEFTQWDGLKWAAQNAVKAGAHDAQVARSHLQHLPEALGNPYPSSSTSNLEKGVRMHGQFAERYLGYAAKDAREALRQAGMTGRYAFEVGRRRLAEGGEPEKPQVFKQRAPSDPLRALADQQDHEHRLAQGLMTAAGIAGDIGLGYAWEKLEQRRRRDRAAVGGTRAA